MSCVLLRRRILIVLMCGWVSVYVPLLVFAIVARTRQAYFHMSIFNSFPQSPGAPDGSLPGSLNQTAGKSYEVPF
jgi:hypothetical protein